ncbi:MAG TPA: YidC/Oxa1 family membrane protein insertase, partial [Rhizobiales bacterium]|nr:YidC/Oxa1 family membrane protein insertase [Hyphomicrobiales bacterium]
MDENNRNFIMAIVLSIAVLLIWQTFYNGPKTKEREALRQQQEQQNAASAPQADPAAGPAAGPANIPKPAADGGPPRPSPSAAAVPGAAPVPAGMGRKSALAESRRLRIETPKLRGSIALTGARIDDLVMTRYRETVNPDSPAVTLFSPSGSEKPFYSEYGWVGDGTAKLKLPGGNTRWTNMSRSDLKPESPVTLRWDNGEGLVFTRTISVDESYMFTVVQEVRNKTGAAITLFPYALISRHGQPEVESFYILHEGLIGVLGEDGLQEINYDDAVEDKVTSFKNIKGGWLGITDKYWAAVIVPDQQALYQARFTGSVVNRQERYQTDYLGSAIQIP